MMNEIRSLSDIKLVSVEDMNDDAIKKYASSIITKVRDNGGMEMLRQMVDYLWQVDIPLGTKKWDLAFELKYQAIEIITAA